MFQTDKDSAVETDGQVYHRIYLTIFAILKEMCSHIKVCGEEK